MWEIGGPTVLLVLVVPLPLGPPSGDLLVMMPSALEHFSPLPGERPLSEWWRNSLINICICSFVSPNSGK